METCRCLEAAAQTATRPVSVMKALSLVVKLVYHCPLVVAYTRVFTTMWEMTSILDLNAIPFATVMREA